VTRLEARQLLRSGLVWNPNGRRDPRADLPILPRGGADEDIAPGGEGQVQISNLRDGAWRPHWWRVRIGPFCPVARASEIVAERWTPLPLRELLAGHERFNQIRRGLHRISPGVLRQRLQRLEQVGVVEIRPNPRGRGSVYHLTEAGLALSEVVESLGVWGQRWLELERRHLDAEALMWAIFTRLEHHRLPVQQVVVKVRFDGHQRSYWLLLSRERPEV
jgi:DNA-binding HxlR family transcriptional regulator